MTIVNIHLRGNVRAYLERQLPAPLLRIYDQHLVCCVQCQALAEQERRIVESLRSDAAVPASLRSALLSMTVEDLAPAPEPAGPGKPTLPVPQALRSRIVAIGVANARAVPAVPARPAGAPAITSPVPLPTVAPGAPALHRSPMRAAVVASLAAGASVMAAWGLASSPISPQRPASVRVPAAGTPSFVPAGYSYLQGGARNPNGVSNGSSGGLNLVSTVTNQSSRSTQRTPSVFESRTLTSAETAARLSPIRISFVSSAQSGP